MEYPYRIYATRKIGTNGISCLDYRNYKEDVEYLRADLVNLAPPNDSAAIRELIEQAHMAGQADAGVDPGYSNSRSYCDTILKSCAEV